MIRGVFTRWTTDPGFWSLVDQSIVSAGNFLTAILVARTLTPAEYGVFALLISLLFVANNLQSSVVCYGLSFYGALSGDAELSRLAGRSLVITMPVALALGSLAGAVTVAFHHAFLAWEVLLALVFWQLQETTRRALMSKLRHRAAVWGDTLSYLGQAVWIAGLFMGHRLTLNAVFQAMAVTSAVALILQAWQLRICFRDIRGAVVLLPKYWGLGRSMFGAWAVGLANSELFIWLLTLRGVAEVAVFQSFVNILRATSPVTTSIQNVLIPAVAARRVKVHVESGEIARRYGLLGACLVVPFYGFVASFPRWALELVYGNQSMYVRYAKDFSLLAIGYAVSYVAAVLGSWAAGLGRGNWVFWSRVTGAMLSVSIGIVLVVRAGILGATVAYGVTFAAQGIVLGLSIRSGYRARESQPATALALKAHLR